MDWLMGQCFPLATHPLKTHHPNKASRPPSQAQNTLPMFLCAPKPNTAGITCTNAHARLNLRLRLRESSKRARTGQSHARLTRHSRFPNAESQKMGKGLHEAAWTHVAEVIRRMSQDPTTWLCHRNSSSLKQACKGRSSLNVRRFKTSTVLHPDKPKTIEGFIIFLHVAREFITCKIVQISDPLFQNDPSSSCQPPSRQGLA